MQIRITWKYIIAFIALNMIMGELHEQAHINTGYLICGCYGPRDFNFWQTCEQCARSNMAFLATLAGPVFSCCLMWLGALWVSKSDDSNKKAIGFALLFANLPFARIFTALTGGGDEKVVIQSLLNDSALYTKIIAAIIVISICLPPMIMVYRSLTNKHRFWIVALFAAGPLIFGMIYQRMFLGSLLKKGIGSGTHILGTPDIILIHFMLMLLLLIFTRKAFIQEEAPYAESALVRF